MARNGTVLAKNGFTLIELLVVIAIIGMLSSIILASVNSARDKARVSQTVSQLREVFKAVSFYINDTGSLPPNCRLTCTSSNDPLINSLGIAGWSGPYLPGGLYNRKHQWGGHIGLNTSIDLDLDGVKDVAIWLDEDAPGTSPGDNSGLIPTAVLEDIDKLVDDGNLQTGNARGNQATFPSGTGAANGEMIIIFRY